MHPKVPVYKVKYTDGLNGEDEKLAYVAARTDANVPSLLEAAVRKDTNIRNISSFRIFDIVPSTWSADNEGVLTRGN